LAAAQLAAVALLADDANAGKVRVLGAAKSVDASCPDDCVVEARVTGFQTRIGARKRPFRVPAAGRIVAWSIKLGRPSKRHLGFFNRSFGRSRARISILKPTRVRTKSGKRKLRFKLRRQSPVQKLQHFFGETTSFGLRRPLKVRKGNVVALTIPTWAPAFSVGLDRARWRASRRATKSDGPCANKSGFANVDAGEPQTRKGGLRWYGCFYSDARLLYSARFVPVKRG